MKQDRTEFNQTHQQILNSIQNKKYKTAGELYQQVQEHYLDESNIEQQLAIKNSLEKKSGIACDVYHNPKTSTICSLSEAIDATIRGVFNCLKLREK